MTLLKNFSLLLLVFITSSCLGDKKAVDVEEIGNTSFINNDFKGNKVNYTKGMSACDQLNAAAIARIYNVSESLVHVEDPTKSDRYKKDLEPACMFFIESGASDFEWLRGGISINREVGANEMMGDIAEAAGNGENWEEAWSLKKSISKSSEWIPNLGKAALWNERKKMLEIKMEGYTIVINPLKNILNKNEVAKNRNYKKLALEMAKASGFIND